MYIGKEFKSRSDVENMIKEYEEKHYCNLRKIDVRTLKAATKRCPKRVNTANQDLEYFSMTIGCKFSGYPKKRDDRKRDTTSFRQSCPFQICLSLSDNGQSLVIKKANEQHNHIISEHLYRSLPRQRTLPDNLKEKVKDAISLKSNSKLLQQKIENSGITNTSE